MLDSQIRSHRLGDMTARHVIIAMPLFEPEKKIVIGGQGRIYARRSCRVEDSYSTVIILASITPPVDPGPIPSTWANEADGTAGTRVRKAI